MSATITMVTDATRGDYHVARLSADMTYTLYVMCDWHFSSFTATRYGNESWVFSDTATVSDDFVVDWDDANEYAKVATSLVTRAVLSGLETARDFRAFYLSSWDDEATINDVTTVKVEPVGYSEKDGSLYKVTVTRGYVRPCPHDDRFAVTIAAVLGGERKSFNLTDPETGMILWECEDCSERML